MGSVGIRQNRPRCTFKTCVFHCIYIKPQFNVQKKKVGCLGPVSGPADGARCTQVGGGPRAQVWKPLVRRDGKDRVYF